jgi:hypothetical protein
MTIEMNPALAPGKGFPDLAHRFGTGHADIAQHPVIQIRQAPARTPLAEPKAQTGDKPFARGCKTPRQRTAGGNGAKGDFGHGAASSGTVWMPGD